MRANEQKMMRKAVDCYWKQYEDWFYDREDPEVKTHFEACGECQVCLEFKRPKGSRKSTGTTTQTWKGD